MNALKWSLINSSCDLNDLFSYSLRNFNSLSSFRFNKCDFNFSFSSDTLSISLVIFLKSFTLSAKDDNFSFKRLFSALMADESDY